VIWRGILSDLKLEMKVGFSCGIIIGILLVVSLIRTDLELSMMQVAMQELNFSLSSVISIGSGRMQDLIL